MRDSVKKAWFDSIVSYEGYTNWLYFDTHNPPLATTGVGNMIDSNAGITNFGLSLPWRFSDGSYATEKAIQSEYDRLKALGIHNKGGFAYKEHAEIFLDEDVVKWMVQLKTEEFFGVLKTNFPKIESWPADAQLALMNMAWWMGPNFTSKWPTFSAALRAHDFLRASENCTTVNPSKRNPDNVRRFTNAAKASYAGLDFDTLWDNKTVYINSAQKIEALLKLTASSVATAHSTVFNIDLWYVQRMLKVLGFYQGPLDGLRTNITNASLRAWAKSHNKSYKSNVEILSLMSNESIKIPVI